MLTKIKRRSGLLVSLAVICATVAVVPMQSASAAMSIVPNTVAGGYSLPADAEVYSACPGTTAPAAGFTDTTSTDVDCIKMFGVTQGTTATTYEPDGTIPRWQMALYIHRMFGPTGVAAAGLTAVPAFTDTSGLSAEIQAAVTALASHGITAGTTATTFSPDDNVTREQMAMFLNRFANIAKDHAGAAIATTAAASSVFNYSDISSATYEGVESIVRLFNLGVTDTCALLASTCAGTYRPNADITRAEMASMVKELLDHTNARPAGVSIQSSASLATTGSKATLISVRNADFSVPASTLVDEFFQLHSDGTTAVPVTAQPAFSAVGSCTAAVTKAANTGTLCVLDSADKATDSSGNVAGTTQVAAANFTANWWAWTGTTGATFNNGTTTSVYALSADCCAASATTEFASVASTFTTDAGKALATSGFAAYNAALDGTDGLATPAGESRTITLQLKGANYAAGLTVNDGYTIKWTHKAVDMLGNVTITNSYTPSSGGKATYTVTCAADNSALTTGVGNANLSYWAAHEITATESTAAGVTAAGSSRPTGAGALTFSYAGTGQHSSSVNISCDDATPTYTKAAASTTLAISANTYPVSTAGSLMSATATAYDQYGDGIAGQHTIFTKGGAAQATMLTGADGSVTITSIVCNAAGTAAWATSDTALPAATDMHPIGATTPTNLIDGTTVYCTTPVNQDGAYTQVTSADQVTTVTANQDATAEGTFTLTVCNGGQNNWWLNPNMTAGLPGAPLCETTADIDAIKANSAAACQAQLRALTMLAADVTCALSANVVLTITYAGDTGGYMTTVNLGVSPKVPPAIADHTATTYAVVQDGTGASTQGKAGLAWTYVDNDATNNTIVVKAVTESSSAVGVTVDQTTYHLVSYDSTDNFSTNSAGADISVSVQGASETQFETAMAALTGLTTPISGQVREGALTSGISLWNLGS